VTKAFLPGMLKKGKGFDHQHVSSIASSVKGLPNRFVYGADQGCGDSASRNRLPRTYVKQASACNCIGPGTWNTPSLGDRINAFSDPAQARKDFIARQPMGRLGTVDDITGILVFPRVPTSRSSRPATCIRSMGE